MKFQIQGFKFEQEDVTFYQIEPCEIPGKSSQLVLSISHGSTDTFDFYDVEFEIFIAFSCSFHIQMENYPRFWKYLEFGLDLSVWQSIEMQLQVCRKEKENNREKT